MTSRNTNSNSLNRPFLLKPMGKDYLWGGNRLNDIYMKKININPLAETWECSVHPDGPSVVASGEYEGRTLPDVLQEHPEFLGSHPKAMDDFPVLIKFIDANKKLSVQVHPDDEYAKEHENGSLGKTEMWYVLDAKEDAEIIYGFNRKIDKEQLASSIESGSIEKYLRKVKVKKDDIFYVEAGTIHGIGEGVLVAEIQENSNLTYRLYDYNRLDKNGNKRELHIEKAMDVIETGEISEPRQPMRVLKYKPGCANELLCRCKYFQVERLLINTEINRDMVEYRTGDNSFQILLCTNGCGSIFSHDGMLLNFFKGDCIFVPASSPKLKIHGKAQLLKVMC